MLSGVTASALAMTGTAVFRIVVSSDSMKTATAPSHGSMRLTASDGVFTEGTETDTRRLSLLRLPRLGDEREGAKTLGVVVDVRHDHQFVGLRLRDERFHPGADGI